MTDSGCKPALSLMRSWTHFVFSKANENVTTFVALYPTDGLLSPHMLAVIVIMLSVLLALIFRRKGPDPILSVALNEKKPKERTFGGNLDVQFRAL